jgi:hypothetical protein
MNMVREGLGKSGKIRAKSGNLFPLLEISEGTSEGF